MTMDRDTTMSAYDVSVHLRETESGHWIIRDETNGKGGEFVDKATAMEFIRRDLGICARPVSAIESEDAAGVFQYARARRKLDRD
jgi:hypothetical protein